MRLITRNIKEVITDPGVGFGVRNILLFVASTNGIGLSACFIATVVAIITKTLGLLRPKGKVSRLYRMLSDNRAPLCSIAVALVIVGITALIAGKYLPAAASLLFAAGNYRMAESISKKLHGETDLADKSRPFIELLLTLIIKRPDIYINIGSICAGTMAGGTALWTIPLFVIATIIAFYNSWKQKPEYNGYPKTITALATLIFTIIAFLNNNILLTLSHALGAAILLNVECRLTPGGLATILTDLKNMLQLKKITPEANKND